MQDFTEYDELKTTLSKAEMLYTLVERYAEAFSLNSTSQLLVSARELLINNATSHFHVKQDAREHFIYTLQVCKLLIELRIPISKEQEDYLLAAELGRAMVDETLFSKAGKELLTVYHIPAEAYKIVRKIKDPGPLTPINQRLYYKDIQEDQLALLAKLGERAVLLDHLYKLSPWDAPNEILLTREFYFPMCIYAKEHYPDIMLLVSILMEKFKLIMEVTDVLSKKYRERETELVNEILTIQEENARLRVSIKEMKANKI